MRGRRQVGPPDFVGVGTYLAGTEWWGRMLRRHPGVAGPAGRAPSGSWFAPFCGRPMTQADVTAYGARFPRRPGQVAGELSDRYAADVWTLPLLARAAPEARVLMLVRDPLAVCARDPGRLHRVRFGSQLRALTAHFALDRILVLQVEQLVRDPVGEYARTLRFLGVRDDVVPRGLRRGPPAQDAPPPLGPDLRASLVAELEPEVRLLLELCPQLDPSLWPHLPLRP